MDWSIQKVIQNGYIKIFIYLIFLLAKPLWAASQLLKVGYYWKMRYLQKMRVCLYDNFNAHYLVSSNIFFSLSPLNTFHICSHMLDLDKTCIE